MSGAASLNYIKLNTITVQYGERNSTIKNLSKSLTLRSDRMLWIMNMRLKFMFFRKHHQGKHLS